MHFYQNVTIAKIFGNSLANGQIKCQVLAKGGIMSGSGMLQFNIKEIRQCNLQLFKNVDFGQENYSSKNYME